VSLRRPPIPRGPSWYETRNSAVTDRRQTAYSFVQVVTVGCRLLTLDYQPQFGVMKRRHWVTDFQVTLRRVTHKRSLRVYRHPNVTPGHRRRRSQFQRQFGSYTLLYFPLRSATFSLQSATEHTSLS